ncbi:(2Fe-2S)-binding protein [Streptomyces sp. CRN 30]|uniref:(2Fe-2S)-binding protein n=1 Tax=Streptomyces sp. CRN 30 TaxID=3075613 RepID=UPI002A822A11|nr:(2Fe-2S)-binding protein [Streptomyces sp. CRN 30]
MSDDQQQGEGAPRSGGSRWDPLPQGDYDDGATAFVQLPEGGIDALLDAAGSPLAAPGHGFVPPPITVSPAAGTDPAATGTWAMPSAPVDGAQWQSQDAGQPYEQPYDQPYDQPYGEARQDPYGTGGQYGYYGPGDGTGGDAEADAGYPVQGQGQGQVQGAGHDDRFAYRPGATDQWDFHEAVTAEETPVPGHDVTGQWSIPVAGGDLPDESGEFTTSSLVEQWGGTPPATLPGGAPAPWAAQATGRPWNDRTPQTPHQEGPGHWSGERAPEARPDAEPTAKPPMFDETTRLGVIRLPIPDAGEAPRGADGVREIHETRGFTEAAEATEAAERPVEPLGAPASHGEASFEREAAEGSLTPLGHGVAAEAAAEVPPEAAAEGAAEMAAEMAAGVAAEVAEPVGGAEAEAGVPAGSADASASEAAPESVASEAVPEAVAPEAVPAAPAAPVTPAASADAASAEAASVAGTAPEPSPDADPEADPTTNPDLATGPEPTTGPEQPPAPEQPPGPDPAPEEPPPLPDPPAAAAAAEEHPLASYVLRVNGADRPVTDAWIGESLLYVLRERLGLAGAKDGCSQGECGACNVQVDGRLVASCLVPAVTAAGSEVRTVEGLAADGRPSDVQRALARCGAVQCGFCVPGMAMTVHDLLEGNPAPTELETRQALCGNLCRCSGYRGVLRAVEEVVAERDAAAGADTAGAAGAADGPAPDADEPRIPHQAGPGAGGVNPSAFDPQGPPGAYPPGAHDPHAHDQPDGHDGQHGQDGGQR